MTNTPGFERRKPDMSPAAGAAMRAVLAEMGEERAFEAVVDPKPLPAREAAQWQRHLLRRNAIEYVRGVGYWASCVPPACLLGGRAASPEVGLLHVRRQHIPLAQHTGSG